MSHQKIFKGIKAALFKSGERWSLMGRQTILESIRAALINEGRSGA